LQEAPGKVSTTCDGWTADNTKGSFLGMTAHWIEVKDETWKLRSEVVGFQPISGKHSGDNLGRYFVGLCDRVGIMSKNESKVRSGYAAVMMRSLITTHQLQSVTLDNASNNTTSCEIIEHVHVLRGLEWDAQKNQLP
jgi:hypothetical protein